MNKPVAVVAVEVPKALVASALDRPAAASETQNAQPRRVSMPVGKSESQIAAASHPSHTFSKSFELGESDSEGDDHVFEMDRPGPAKGLQAKRHSYAAQGSSPDTGLSSPNTPFSPHTPYAARMSSGSSAELVPAQITNAGELELRNDGGERRVNLRVTPDGAQVLGLGVLGEPGRAAPIFISSIAPGSAADDNGGLRVGDRILSINGRSCEEITQGRAQELLAKASMRMTLVVRHEAVAFERYKSSERRLKPKVPPAPARLCVLARPGRVPDPEFDLGLTLTERPLESGRKGVFVSQVISSAPAGHAGIVRGDRVLAVGDQDTTFATVDDVRNAIMTTGRAVMINLAFRPLEFASAKPEESASPQAQAQPLSPALADAPSNSASPRAAGHVGAGGGFGGAVDTVPEEEAEDEDNDDDPANSSFVRPGDADDGEEEDDEDDLAEEEDEFDAEELDMHSRARKGTLNHRSSAMYTSDEDDLSVALRRITTGGSRHDHDRHRSRLYSGANFELGALDEEEDSGLAHARYPRLAGRTSSMAEAEASPQLGRRDRRRPSHDNSDASDTVVVNGSQNRASRDGHTAQIFVQEHYPGAPKVHRSVVHECDWELEDATYNPIRYTDRAVLHTRRADPNLTRNQRRGTEGQLESILHFNTMDGDVDRRSHQGRYDLGPDGLPRNPHGRTGLRGRGLYNLWGPNHAVHVLVTRWCRETVDGVDRVVQEDGRPVLEVMTLNDMDIGQQCLPSVFLRPAEEPATAIERALEYAGKGQVGTAPLTATGQARPSQTGTGAEGGAAGGTAGPDAGRASKRDSKDSEASDVALYGANPNIPMHAQAAQLVKQRVFRNEIINMQIHSGLLDDPRNTDNAWIETLAINYHDDAGLLNGIEFSEPGIPGTSPVQWTRVAADSLICSEQQQLLRELSAAHQAFYQRKRRRRQSNTALLAVHLQRTSNDPFGFKLGTTAQGAHVIHSVDPSSLAAGYLLTGDIVLDVNHNSIVGWSHQDVRRYLKNNATLHLLVKRKRLPGSGGSRKGSGASAQALSPVMLPPPTAAARSELMRLLSDGKVVPVEPDEPETHSSEALLEDDAASDSQGSRSGRSGRSRRRRRQHQGSRAAAAASAAAASTAGGTASVDMDLRGSTASTGRAGRMQSHHRHRQEKAQRMEVQLQRDSLGEDFDITIGSDSTGVHEISGVKVGSHAAEVVRVGDAVAAINGVDLAGKSHEEVEDLCVDATKLMLTLVRPPAATSKFSRRLKSMHHSTMEWMRHPTLHGGHHHGHGKHGEKASAAATHKKRGVVGHGPDMDLSPTSGRTVPVVEGVVGRTDDARHRWQTVELKRLASGGFGVEITHTISNQHIVTGCCDAATASQLQRGDHVVSMNGLEVPELTRRVMEKLASFTDRIVLKVVRGCDPAAAPPAESKTLNLGLDERHAKQLIETLGPAAASTLMGGTMSTSSAPSSPAVATVAEAEAEVGRGESGGRAAVARRSTQSTEAHGDESGPNLVDIALQRVKGKLGLRLTSRENQETGELIIVVDEVTAPPASQNAISAGQELIAARSATELQWHNMKNRSVEEATALLSKLGEHVELRLSLGSYDHHFASMRRSSAITKHPSIRVKVEDDEGDASAHGHKRARRRRSKMSVESM